MSASIQFFWDSLLGRNGWGWRLLAYWLWFLLWAVVLVLGAVVVNRIVG